MAERFNVAAEIIDRQAGGERTAIECGEERVTYRQLLERTNQAGKVLRALGVRREERVVLLLLDGPVFLYSFFGAIKIGAVPVPVNTMLRPAELAYILNDTQARVAIVSRELLPQIEAIAAQQIPHLHTTIIADARSRASGLQDERGDGRQRLRERMEAAPGELEPEPMGEDDPAFWLYSSGSTGMPKGCVHRQHDMLVASERYAKGILHMNERDRCYSVPRLFFAYGLGNAGYFPLYCGATTILWPARPTPASIYADIERYRPTLFFSVPTNYAALLAHEPGRNFDLSSVRHAISAGEALPAPIYHRFKERFGVEILDAWGSTETLHMAISNRPGEAKAGASGKVIPGYEAKIVDGEGRPVAIGEIGNLMIKSDATCSGYWNQPERTKDVFVGEWFRTGDKYHQDADGYFWYAGRGDDMFKVAGKWVSPVEVESALLAHNAVREAAVVGRDDGSGLTKPAAYVVVNAGVEATDKLAAELQEWVSEKIGGYKRPRWIEYVEGLPKTATGKLQRFKLRERASASSPGRPATHP